ncbi:hypothetical protein ACOMHN_032980 [Nucella lapillus]
MQGLFCTVPYGSLTLRRPPGLLPLGVQQDKLGETRKKERKGNLNMVLCYDDMLSLFTGRPERKGNLNMVLCYDDMLSLFTGRPERKGNLNMVLCYDDMLSLFTGRPERKKEKET